MNQKFWEREDSTHEFKNYYENTFDADEMTVKIVCGFLNNEGGILYYGIHDSGTIKGIEP